jgi:hypothetical protein
MKIRNPFVVVCTLAALAPAAPWAHAQVLEGTPIAVREKPPKDQNRFKGEVIAATNSSITVRDATNERRICTFTYSPALSDKMKGIMARGVYQPGDKVKIRYHSQTGEAWNIKGKPSAPL